MLVGIRLYTVFSASNYSDGSNDGAVLHYTSLPEPEIHCFRTTETPTTAEVPPTFSCAYICVTLVILWLCGTLAVLWLQSLPVLSIRPSSV